LVLNLNFLASLREKDFDVRTSFCYGVKMTDEELFDELDLDGDGMLSQQELHWAACQFGWDWRHAPIYALLDFLTIRSPLAKDTFISCMAQVGLDPDGAYGQVLSQGPLMAELSRQDSSCAVREPNPGSGSGTPCSTDNGTSRNGTGAGRVFGRPEDILSDRIAGDYATALERLNVSRFGVRSDETALLIIDPQRSFTSGAWMQSMGPKGELEVKPIRLAFDNCAALLKAVYQRVEVMFTRCPFPPESYGWDERLDGIINSGQLYFIKPGNNVLIPRTNGFRDWVENLIKRGKHTLVMGGCTLNSCLRVSAIETRRCFGIDQLNVVVDLSRSGARTSNYVNSSLFGGMSSVEFAIREMSAAGVTVAELVEWL
jgi:nicotinamidase-related amidase